MSPCCSAPVLLLPERRGDPRPGTGWCCACALCCCSGEFRATTAVLGKKQVDLTRFTLQES